jgi:hypothetical protein
MRAMDVERAAEVLGVAPGASRREVSAAFARRARSTHPDVTGGDAEAFQEALDARDTLLLAAATDGRPTASAPRSASAASGMPAPRLQGPGMLAVWAGLIALAGFLAIYAVDHPLHPVEAVVRWTLLGASAVAFGATGRRGFLGVALALIAATVVFTLLETSLGGLLGLLLLVPAMYGLSLAGLARRRFRLRAR